MIMGGRVPTRMLPPTWIGWFFLRISLPSGWREVGFSFATYQHVWPSHGSLTFRLAVWQRNLAFPRIKYQSEPFRSFPPTKMAFDMENMATQYRWISLVEIQRFRKMEDFFAESNYWCPYPKINHPWGSLHEWKIEIKNHSEQTSPLHTTKLHDKCHEQDIV